MFLENALITAEQVAVLYIIVAVGFFADKVKLFTEKTAMLCTNLLFYIITPAVIIESFLKIDYDKQTVRELFIAMGCGMIMFTVSILINLPFFRKGDNSKNCVLRFASIFSNCGYMSIPLANSVVGPQGVLYCSAVVVCFQIFSFTYGVMIMDKSESKSKINFKKIVLNPGVISVAIGLPLFLLGVKLPEIITAPIGHISNMNTPLAMLVFGTYLANAKIKSAFKEKKIFLAAFIKLIMLPLIMLLVYRLFNLQGALIVSLIITASAPSANNTVIFAAKYERDAGLAAQAVAIISIISILTMPLMIALSGTV